MVIGKWLENQKDFKPFFTTANHFNFKQFFSTFASFENKIFFLAVHKSWFIIYMSRHLASVLSLGSLVVQKRLYLFSCISCIIILSGDKCDVSESQSLVGTQECQNCLN